MSSTGPLEGRQDENHTRGTTPMSLSRGCSSPLLQTLHLVSDTRRAPTCCGSHTCHSTCPTGVCSCLRCCHGGPTHLRATSRPTCAPLPPHLDRQRTAWWCASGVTVHMSGPSASTRCAQPTHRP